MAFTRAFLKSAGLTDEQITAIMEEHVSVVTGLKDDRDRYKAEAEKLPDLQKQVEDLKGGEDYKTKWETEHKAFEDYKGQVAQEAEAAKVRAAYRRLLADCRISEKRLDAICKVTDFSKMKLDKDGNLTDADALRASIQNDWGDFVSTTTERGVNVETPPENAKSTRSKAEILAIKDTAERQKAIADNHALFGF